MKEIETEREYKKALDKIEELLKIVGNETSTKSKDFIELDEISDLVADYEEKYYPIPKPSLIETIELRMFERKLKQKDLAELLGTSNTRISEFLKGKRKLNIELAKALYKRLDVDPELILGS